MTVQPIRFDPDIFNNLSNQEIASYFDHAGGSLVSGYWQSAPESLEINLRTDQFELCVILAGEVELTYRDGGSHVFKERDIFVMPGGTQCIWRTVRPVKKFYMICN
ncbi:cupin domain-containing protein [Pseudomonas veronii]|uniref:cupin domain-containing protein n=1 Tax=Pseudomonas veronii TaxID=76761 RepID=UPI0009A50A67|nr:cupin domain-containing protein [Pseudomonas veronii]AQY65707.1 hypothetical protein PverR02_11850 [Pseudomonas veronii]